jgi:hypothetical protein
LATKPLLEGNRGRRLSGQSATGTRYFDNAETLAAVSTNQVGTIRKRREGQSNAEMDEPAAAERSATASHRSAGRNQLPATSVEVDSATSSFGRNGKASKKVNDTSKASNLKIEKASSAAHKPSKSSRGQQQLRIEIRQVAESNSREQKSRQAAKADTKSNRTRVNSELLSKISIVNLC